MNALPGQINDLSITRPTLVVDKKRALRNIEKMTARARAGNVRFRPHFKTHQSAEIGRWFRGQGVDSITVSSVTMARYFAANGWSDITIAFPVNILELQELTELAGTIDLGLLVDSEAALAVLGEALGAPARVWIKVDTGYGRAGLPWDDPGSIVSLAGAIDRFPCLTFAGILTHEGRTYGERTMDGIKRIHDESISRLSRVKKELAAVGIGPCLISTGDTPSCSLFDDFPDVDEIRPGNFVFNDLMQTAMGSCSDSDIAVALACPVVGHYERRKEIVVYGGAVHLSRESLNSPSGTTIFGCVARPEGTSLGRAVHDAPVISLSQEHGVIRLPDELFASIGIGDVLPIYPVHSCLTCNLHSEYVTLDGERISRL